MTLTTLEWLQQARAMLATAPTEEPVTLGEANAHLRLDTADDEAMVDSLITMARLKVEQDTGRALCTQTWDIYWDAVPPASTLLLPKAPLQWVTSITSYDDAGTPAVLSSANYAVDIVSEPARIVLTPSGAWPSDVRDYNAFVVRAVCGYGGASAVPRPLIHAMLLLMCSLYEHRKQVAITQFAGQFIEVPFGYKELIMSYRLGWVC